MNKNECLLEKTTCVYRHRRLDKNEIFYVGIGNIKRPYNTHNRNNYWKNISNKTEYEIEIIAEDLDWDTACELEVLLISEYGRINLKTGTLCNLTDGGEGNKGWNPSKITRDKMRDNNLGKRMSEESKEKCKIAGKKGSLQWSKKVKCTVTNKEWNSITDCAKEININMKLLSAYLNNSRKNKTTIIYLKDYEQQ